MDSGFKGKYICKKGGVQKVASFPRKGGKGGKVNPSAGHQRTEEKRKDRNPKKNSQREVWFPVGISCVQVPVRLRWGQRKEGEGFRLNCAR